MFIYNPDPFLLPSFRISPFKTEFIEHNNDLQESNYDKVYFDNKFGNNWQYTLNGREAIKLALNHYKLDRTDLVTILTTSNNFYISSCVTKEIEQICRWNREITAETKVIFVNHEFGYPFQEMEDLKKMNIPIIEDCCTTFFSQDKNDKIGKYGDFSIYSFPKFFPIQIGGLIVKNVDDFNNRSSLITFEEERYIKNVLSDSLQNEQKLLLQRKENFEFAFSQLSELGFTLRFETKEKIVPSVLLLNNNNIIKDLSSAKEYLFKHGIQCSVFYGEDAFFIPNHQNLSRAEMIYISECIKNYIKINL
ncbi:DegT/DnrJ/EryC1/StrS family aminotransferase [Flavobacterium branchiicola]|uniref:DegT/DnrJ/EryC1/StrS family aminotransferase n=1 Tax=Flavobacterium branchiicola TaxID=1114875 RepID=A0ABV9PFD1_9FLAO|nr:DegT/DnrJ/EryC1/StrS family aminotransferase [Flavobacterium branchiicola]MBS7255450.1 DegT/DnrJ/EryC1/StrS aminotransferase family protein [Flavobacterium branchiicola]